MSGTIEAAILWTPWSFPRGWNSLSAEVTTYLQPSSILKMTAATGLLSFTYMLHTMERKLGKLICKFYSVNCQQCVL